MVDKNNLFGLETVHKLYDDKVAKKEDILILLVHWYFIKHGFKCIGLSDSKTFDSSEKGSELLPNEWNTGPNYALRYVYNENLYIFHAIKSDEDLLMNLLRVKDNNVSNTQFNIDQTVTGLHGSIETIVPSLQTVLSKIQEDLFTAVVTTSSEISTQTTSEGEKRERDTSSSYIPDPLMVGQPSRPGLGRWAPTPDAGSIGSADLNPFAPGGGMIFDPFTNARHRTDPTRPALGVPGRLPPGSIPPHARFDPFGPPDMDLPRPRPAPGADHLPPPGFDNMFM